MLTHAVTKLAMPISQALGIEPLTHVFVDNFDIIPTHRLYPLFSTLVRAIGVENLHSLIMQLFQKGKGGFAHLLCHEFPPQSCVDSFQKMLEDKKDEVPFSFLVCICLDPNNC